MTAVAFARDGRHILAAGRVDALKVAPVMEAPTPVPDGFPGWLEAVAGKRLDDHGDLVVIGRETLRRTGTDSSTRSKEDFYDRWVRWFLEDRFREPTPPFAAPRP